MSSGHSSIWNLIFRNRLKRNPFQISRDIFCIVSLFPVIYLQIPAVSISPNWDFCLLFSAWVLLYCIMVQKNIRVLSSGWDQGECRNQSNLFCFLWDHSPALAVVYYLKRAVSFISSNFIVFVFPLEQESKSSISYFNMARSKKPTTRI